MLLCSLLPMAAPALSRADGAIWLGLQVQHGFGDPSRDLRPCCSKALDAEPGEGVVGLTDAPGEGPRLQDLVADAPLEVTVHDGFDYWVADVEDPTARSPRPWSPPTPRLTPTVRLTSVEAAYWTDVGTREHLRWVLPHDEEQLLDALARLHAAGPGPVAEGSRLVGMFRAHGLLAPVWDLPRGHRRRRRSRSRSRGFGDGPRGRPRGRLRRSAPTSARRATVSPTGSSPSADDRPGRSRADVGLDRAGQLRRDSRDIGADC